MCHMCGKQIIQATWLKNEFLLVISDSTGIWNIYVLYNMGHLQCIKATNLAATVGMVGTGTYLVIIGNTLIIPILMKF